MQQKDVSAVTSWYIRISCPSLWDAEAWNVPAERFLRDHTSTAYRHANARHMLGWDPDDTALVAGHCTDKHFLQKRS
jgi:hypothetical protein